MIWAVDFFRESVGQFAPLYIGWVGARLLLIEGVLLYLKRQERRDICTGLPNDAMQTQ